MRFEVFTAVTIEASTSQSTRRPDPEEHHHYHGVTFQMRPEMQQISDKRSVFLSDLNQN
jgi:hypothetical protein